MAIGSGKYDHLATYVREQSQAEAVILIVVAGDRGGGFSVQAHTPDVAMSLPALLRRIANDIEANL